MKIEKLTKNENFVEISEFYNKQFPLSPHSPNFKKTKYTRQDFIGFKAVDADDEIIGLVEGWVNEGVTVFATLCVDDKHRGKGIAKKLFESFLKQVKTKEVVLHFRDSKKDKLKDLYSKFGFKVSDKKNMFYSNNEKKWEMSLVLECIK